ncbi:MAG: EAL domain-containing protein [Eubacterium sp.]|nr:EAL domain-containing protein [Eubacterium sp.]
MEKYKYNEIEHNMMEQSAVPFAIYQFIDKQVVTIVLSQGMMDLFGWSDRTDAYNLMDNDMYRDTHPDDVARISDAAIRFAKDDEPYNVIYRTMINGEYKVIHAFGKHIYPEVGVRLAIVWYVNEGNFIGKELVSDNALTHDYSIALSEASLQRKYNYDFLTGIPNMTYFFELAKAASINFHEKGIHCSMCFANFNGLKYFNKKYGFKEGDKLIRYFSALLIKYFGNNRACRIDQDNFAFIAQSDKLEKNLNDLFKELDRLRISVRVGIYPDTIGIVETSVACDRARYACNTLKNSNESKFVRFDKSMLALETRRQYILDNLDKAIRENWIQAYYQPIVRSSNGKVSDEEALARWIDPEKGMLSPAEFIPILEDEGLIYKVDLHMVDQVLHKMKEQEKKGFYVIPTSINLSRTDFDACDIVDEICKRVDAAGISRKLITIEITESVVGSDFDFIKDQVEKLHSLGFSVWMDDFGSGYSSLDVLQSIHFDVIKFDMSFMRQFDNGNKSKVILTELMKMAIGLDIETVTEGVETKEQVDFLREIGCTRLQGYYYSKPNSFSEILSRYEKGIQIGFENPEETDYYASIGKINLYDMASVASEEDNFSKESVSGDINQYFNTLPMAVIEVNDEGIRVNRCNKSYREFLNMMFGKAVLGRFIKYDKMVVNREKTFFDKLKKCSKYGGKEFVEERKDDGTSIHFLIRRIAVNPVNGIAANVVAVLGVVKKQNQGLTYADIANSLSADYNFIYYINIETEDFIEYSPNSSDEDIAVERHGTDFFNSSHEDAKTFIYKDDLERFTNAFNRENVLSSIDKQGSFTITYRLLVNEKPTYVNLKALRMSKDKNHIIIGVSNVDTQMRQQEALEKMRQERITYSKMMALSRDYICIYTVDPVTEKYVEYGATGGYENMGLAKSGDAFFKRSAEEISRLIYEDDRKLLIRRFTKEKVLQEIQKNGVYILNYRLMIEQKPTYVSLKAAMIEEDDGQQIIIGISNIDSQVRRDLGEINN